MSNGDSIFTEKLKFCDINDKVLIGSLVRKKNILHFVFRIYNRCLSLLSFCSLAADTDQGSSIGLGKPDGYW